MASAIDSLMLPAAMNTLHSTSPGLEPEGQESAHTAAHALETTAPEETRAPENAAASDAANAPEWIDVSPDALPDGPRNPPAPSAAPPVLSTAIPEEPPEVGRGHARVSSLGWILVVVGVALATRWLTWRQSVMYQPPLELSALVAPTLSPGARALAAITPPAPAVPAPSERAPEAPRKIMVHVIGAVKRPGVFEMQAGSRLKDALHWAGGVLPGADLEAINLAEALEDGRQYRVPARQSPADATQAVPQVLAAPRPRVRAAVRTAERAPQPEPRSSPRPRATSAKAPRAPIDLNAATLEDLQQLPGVGPATAQRIIDYRSEIGGFKSVDDLDGVKGIGPKKLDKIRPWALVR